jgi:ribosomal-protein-alanine N-acetyltransferase
VRLRAVTAGDGDALHAIFTQPGVRKFLFDDILLTREQTQAHVEAATRHDAWVVCENDRPGDRVVGFVSLRPTGEDVELMVAIGEQDWGRGLAYSASAEALRHGFEIRRRSRILAAVDLPNERSHKLMKSLGFTSTGESDGPKYRLRHYEALRRSGT